MTHPSLKNWCRGYLPALLVTLTAVLGELPAKAETFTPKTTAEIAQAANAAQNQALQEKATQIIKLLSDGQYAKAREAVSPKLAVKLSAEQIEQTWQNLIAGTGRLEKIVKSKVINTINADLVVVTVKFQKVTDDFIVTFNKTGEIVGINFPKLDSIDRIAEIFVNALANNDFTRARGYLHPFLKAELFSQQVEQKWNALIAQTGRVKRIVGTNTRTGSTAESNDVVIVTIEFAKTTQDMFVIFDKDRRIVGVDFPQI
jgi:DNA-binding TFAR19-related protein (PDSD5 family)